jgi:hypothetical protein
MSDAACGRSRRARSAKYTASRLTRRPCCVLILFVSIALPIPGLARSFSLVIAGLCRATASRIAVDRCAGPLLIRIFTRLHRLAARLTSLVAQVQAGGTLPPPRPRHPVARPDRRERRQARLPASSGWLLGVVPSAAEYAGQVQALLDDPETAALLAAAPRAGRLLRPLCRMLALPLPDHLRRSKPRSTPPATGADMADPSPDPAPAISPARPPPFCAAPAASHREAPATGLPPRPD